jgi:hypothetical protein
VDLRRFVVNTAAHTIFEVNTERRYFWVLNLNANLYKKFFGANSTFKLMMGVSNQEL